MFKRKPSLINIKNRTSIKKSLSTPSIISNNNDHSTKDNTKSFDQINKECESKIYFDQTSFLFDNSFNFSTLNDAHKEMYIRKFPQRKKNHLYTISNLLKSIDITKQIVVLPASPQISAGDLNDKKLLSAETTTRKSKLKKLNMTIMMDSIKLSSNQQREFIKNQSIIIGLYDELGKKYNAYFKDLNNMTDFLAEENEINMGTIEIVTKEIMQTLKENNETTKKYNSLLNDRDGGSSIESKILSTMESNIKELDAAINDNIQKSFTDTIKNDNIKKNKNLPTSKKNDDDNFNSKNLHMQKYNKIVPDLNDSSTSSSGGRLSYRNNRGSVKKRLSDLEINDLKSMVKNHDEIDV